MLINPKHWPSLSRLLDEALDMSPEAREGWLESLPPADSAYKEELRTLLQHQHGSAQDTQDFLDILPNLKEAVDNARAAVHGTSLRPGVAVGPYVVEREIGSGGMGAVWLARRGDGLIKRPVALKLPHAGPHGRHLAERFASERDILAELSHPNIARLYDAGFAEDGQPFLALEYVAGAPLIEYCDQQRLDVHHRLRLFQQVLRAVQYAHGNLVIHRDLKPSNVIVGNDGRAMLLDFGIARLIAIEPRDDSGRPPAGQAGGALTPDYASPEQISGQAVTTSSDIYSLGVLLFELLTGERPYSTARMSLAQLEQAIMKSDPGRPSQALRQSAAARDAAIARGSTVRALVAQLTGDLDAITLKALEKTPAARYATADALSADIESYLEGEPIAARRNNRWYRARKFVVRHKPYVVAATAALLAVIATAGIALYEAHAAAGHARVAAAERDRALALSSRNEAIADFLNVLITESAASDRPLTSSDMLARSEALVSAEFRGNTQHRTAVLDLVGAYYRTMGDEKRSLRLLQQAYDTIASSPDADLRRKVTCDLALTLGNLGRLPEARAMLERVIGDPQSTAQQAAECLAFRSIVAGQIESDPAGAVKYGQMALRRLRTLANPSAATEAGILGAIADGERLAGHSSVAEEYFRQALQQYESAGRDKGPDATVTRNNLAVVYDATGNPKHALQVYDEILQSAAQVNSGALPVVTVGNRARALELIGRFDAAREGYAHCIALSIQGELPLMHMHCLAGLAWTTREAGDLKAADRYLSEAYELARSSASAPGPSRILLEITRGRIALANNQLAAARASLDTALEEGNTVFFQMAALVPRAELNLKEGRLAAAEADARRALALSQAAQGGVPHSYRTGLSWLILGRVLAAKGDTVGARQALLAAIDHLSNTVDLEHPLLLLARQLVRG